MQNRKSPKLLKQLSRINKLQSQLVRLRKQGKDFSAKKTEQELRAAMNYIR